ncbi:MAG: Cell division protein, partial [Candidatus Daviesbacteria bacterium GW2011_GWB1_41_5]
IRRNPYQAMAASLVMFLTFLTLSIFLILALGSQAIIRYYESKPQAIAFFKDGTTEADVTAIKNALGTTNLAAGFKYVSKEEALQIYRQRNKDNPMLLELVTANILPASLEISARAPEDLKPIAEIVKKEPVVEDVVFPEEIVSSLTQATKLIRVIGAVVVSFLVVFSTLITTMIIGFKIRVKRDEIETMKLLGAANWFIRMPYILEGLFYASFGAVLGLAVSFGILWYFSPLIQNNLGEVAQNIAPFSLLTLGGLFAVELFVAALVGGLGSLLAVRRYMRI